MKCIYKLLLTICCIAVGFSCTKQVSGDKIITVTIEPQQYFAGRLADSLFRIVVMVPAGTSPETYDPSPVQMAELAKSVAYFRIGHIGFEEAWIDKIAANNPQLKIYNNSEHIELITSENDSGHEGHDHEGHDHASCEHQHAGGVDPHTWSSPKEALTIVRNMYNALVELAPEHKALFDSNLAGLEAEIQETDSIVSNLLEKCPNKAFIIYHPALSYFARDYGLAQYSIEIDGKEPSPEQLGKLIETAREKGVKTIFIQQEFDKKNAEIIAKETNCKLTVINPLAYDWKTETIRIAKALSDE